MVNRRRPREPTRPDRPITRSYTRQAEERAQRKLRLSEFEVEDKPTLPIRLYNTQQTEGLAANDGHASCTQEAVPDNNKDRNESAEQEAGPKDATATPDSAPQEPRRQEPQLAQEITVEEGPDTRIEPGILDILDSE